MYVENLTDGGLGVQMIVVNKEGNKVDEIRFKNGYTGEKTGNVARTGDVSDIGLWIILLAVSGVVAGKQCIRNDRLDKPIGEEKIYIRDVKAS